MRIIVLSDARIRIEPSGKRLTVEAEDADADFSPFHMLAGGLGACVFSLLYTWAVNAHLSPDDLALEVGWHFAEQPYRVGRYDVELHWPSLPEERRVAAARVVAACPVHATLEHPTQLVTTVRG